MQAIWMTAHGGTDVLQVRETRQPTPGPREVAIRTAVAGLNFSDVIARLGLYPSAPKPPCILGYEVSGVIEHVGSDVTTLAAGDRVVAMTNFRGHAEIVCVSISQVVKLPAMLSFEAAAALPVNYLTARHMLTTVAGVRAGETVLVHMAAGGVGLALLQLCRNIGSVRVIGTAS